MLVGGFTLAGVGVDGVDVNVQRHLAIWGNDVRLDTGLLGQLAESGLQKRRVLSLEMAAVTDLVGVLS